MFLDRDGVLNDPIVRERRPYPPATVEDLVVCAGAPSALGELASWGFALICVTNQPDVARGTTSRRQVDAINRRLQDELPLDDVIVCPHDDRDGCGCRKPKPGLLYAGAERFGIDLARSYMVGDRWRDIDAGASAGCRTVLIDVGYDERQPTHPPAATVASIAAAARWIVDDSQSSAP